VIEQWLSHFVRPIVDSIVYSVLGAAVLFVAFKLVDRITPFSLLKEIEEDQNVGLGIVLGAFILGLSIIIAAAIRG
jgi:putative membrane protein